MAARKHGPVQYPSETYEARVRRARPIVAFSLSSETSELIGVLAKRFGCTRSDVVTEAVEAYARHAARRRGGP